MINAARITAVIVSAKSDKLITEKEALSIVAAAKENLQAPERQAIRALLREIYAETVACVPEALSILETPKTPGSAIVPNQVLVQALGTPFELAATVIRAMGSQLGFLGFLKFIASAVLAFLGIAVSVALSPITLSVGAIRLAVLKSRD